MYERLPQNGPEDEDVFEETQLPEARLREIAKMKRATEREIIKLKALSGREKEIAALQETLDSLAFDERSAREELRHLN